LEKAVGSLPWGLAGGWDAWGKGKGMAGKGTGSGPPASTGQTYVGTLKSFNEVNNYGFISCDEVKAKHGNDTFVHGRSLANLNAEIGTRLEFELGISTRGQPQAMDVRLEGQPAPSKEPAAKKPRTEESPFQDFSSFKPRTQSDIEDIDPAVAMTTDLNVLLGD